MKVKHVLKNGKVVSSIEGIKVRVPAEVIRRAKKRERAS